MDIVCITEPYITDFPKKYNIIAIKNRPNTAIVIANNTVKYNVIKCDQDYIVINITYYDSNIIIINIYSPPSSDFMETINNL